MLTVTLTLAPSGLTAPVDAGQSLLEAALAAGIRLPSSCRNGTCRACFCRIEAGQVRYRVDWPGLSLEEKAEGWTLPCVALPLGDVTLLQPLAHSVFGDDDDATPTATP
jgi:ferredoxin